MLHQRLLPFALFSARWTASGGFALITGGCALLAFLPDVGVPTGRLLTAFGLMGTGLGLASNASTTAGTDAAPAPHRGVSSGLVNATAQIGTALGLALVIPAVAVTSPRWGFAAAGLIAVLGVAAGRLLPAERSVRVRSARTDQNECRRSEATRA